MTAEEIHGIVEKQNAFFQTNATLQVSYRIENLKKLYKAIAENEAAINAALQEDLGKSAFESYMCEVGLVLSELSYMIKHAKRYAREKAVTTPLAQFASRSFRKPSPYGTVLIMSPWNYPFLLTLDPLIDALAAGNTAIVKPSAYSPATSKVMTDLLQSCFSPEYVAVINGGRAENSCLLNEKFDYIFFTGSQAVGKEVMQKAASHLTPVTLELGGKSPCIVDKTANLKLAAKRIVFGKYLNCGQTCVAPDYVYCERSVADKLIAEIKLQIRVQLGGAQKGDIPADDVQNGNILENPEYGKIINEKHFHRILGLIDSSKTVYGGKSNTNTLQIEPTVMKDVTWDDAVMKEEIFGPIMPILTFDTINEVIKEVNMRAKPLALYLFTSDKSTAKLVTSSCSFGGGCINDTIIHLATSYMPFGGVGESGMGGYHGKSGFETFSHYKSIVDKKTWIDLPMRYHPYTGVNEKLLRMFLK